jgi:hypothetical protein
MPEQLSLATVATCAVLAGAVFGGAYALAHDGPAEPAAPASPTTIRLKDDPIGALRRVSPLPALIVPPPRTEPAAPAPVVEEPPAIVPAAAPAPAPEPAPAPAPAPKPQAPPKKPLTFDDSG